MNIVPPWRMLTSGLVRASTKNSLATLPLAMNIFSPLRIHSSPSRSALSRSRPWGRPPAACGCRSRRRWLGDALAEHEGVVGEEGLEEALLLVLGAGRAIRWLHFQHWLKVFDIALSPRASSAITSAWVTKSVPWPPHSFGTASVRKPSFEPFLMISQSKVSAGSAIWSRSSEIGTNFLLGELARLHLPAALLVVSEKSMCSMMRRPPCTRIWA
jgi:hypothetical protein